MILWHEPERINTCTKHKAVAKAKTLTGRIKLSV